MRLFWTDAATSAPSSSLTLPPRKLNLTELQRMGDEMARLLGGEWSLRSSFAHLMETRYALGDLANLQPDERAAVRIWAEAKRGDSDSVPPNTYLQLCALPLVGGVLPAEQWAQVHPAIRMNWEALGRPTLRGWWLYPAAFVGALVLALGGAVVLWVLEPRLLWLGPLVVFAMFAGYTAGKPWVNYRIMRYRAIGRPLPIDFRLREKVREQRAATKEKWKDRAWGFVTALVLAVPAIVTLAVKLQTGM